MEKPSNPAASAHKVRVTDLPQFAQGKWRKAFFPTLYDKFFTSNEPFDAFAKGSDDFIALLQPLLRRFFLRLSTHQENGILLSIMALFVVVDEVQVAAHHLNNYVASRNGYICARS